MAPGRHKSPEEVYMATMRLHSAVLGVLLGACAADDGDAGDTGGSTTEDVGAEASSSSEGPNEPASSSGSEGESTSGPGITLEEFEVMCGSQASQQACEAAATYENLEDGLTAWCTWGAWFDVAIDDAGVCTFGRLEYECGMAYGGEGGCLDDAPNCGSAEAWGRTTREGDVQLTTFGGCGPYGDVMCVFSNDVQLDGPPECACLCDPAFPGG
jgi:hypothetical protein